MSWLPMNNRVRFKHSVPLKAVRHRKFRQMDILLKNVYMPMFQDFLFSPSLMLRIEKLRAERKRQSQDAIEGSAQDLKPQIGLQTIIDAGLDIDTSQRPYWMSHAVRPPLDFKGFNEY